MKKLLEYGQLLAFLVLAFWCFDLLKEKFKSKETDVTEEYKEKIKKAFSSENFSTNQPVDLSKKTENKIEEEKPTLQNSTAKTRDPILIGTWSKFSKYNRNSMNTDENWVFNSDGTMAMLSHNYAIIYENVEGNIDNGWVENATVKAEIEAGYRWFTKDNKVFYHAPDGSEILLFYYSIEHYNGKINMFTRQNPNQEKASASLTKIN